MKLRDTLLRSTCLLITLLMAALAFGSEPIIPAPPQLAARGYLLIDADTGKILVEHNSDERLPPASLTKIMTAYVAATELKRGVISLDDMVNVSVKAWRMEGSRMFIQEGTRVSVEDLLRGIIVQSGNDASVALAEYIAGSEDAFADMMNQHAQRLGMKNSHFMNATGLPHENHYITAHDLGLLAVALIREFPEHYKLYSERYFTFNNIRQPNRNTLLWRDPSVDGVKTGHTEEAGYCLVSSARRNDMRLVGVVMGTDSEEARAAESQKLLTYGFRYYETMHLYAADETLKNVRVWGGEKDNVDLSLAKDVVVTIPRGTRDGLEASMDINRVIKAPVKRGQVLGYLKVALDGKEINGSSLGAVASVDEAGFFRRVWDAIALFFLRLFGGDPLAT